MSENKNSLLFQIEKDIARLLVYKLKDQQITLDRASLIAKFVLVHLPENLSDEQVIQILPTLDDEFVELASVVNKYMSEYEDTYSKIMAEKMQELIKHKHFDEANHMAKEYFKQKFM